MENILRTFRGDPEMFEITRAMKYLLYCFVAMFIFVPIAVYTIFQDISDQVLHTVFSFLMVDIVCMFGVNMFVVLVWCPYFYPDRSTQTRSQSDPSQRCQTTEELLTTAQPSACSRESNIFRDIPVYGLSGRVNQMFDAKGNKDSSEGCKKTKNAYALDLSSVEKLNIDQNRTSLVHEMYEIDPRTDKTTKLKRHHSRFWTELQSYTRGIADGNEQRASDSFEELSIPMKPETPQTRSFRRFKLKCDRTDYLVSFRRRRDSKTFIESSRIDDDLGLVPVSINKSKCSATEDWVFNEKNKHKDSDSKVRFAHRRSRSVPWTKSSISNSSATKWTIPCSVDDTRHRVLHRLLATILTTGDDDTLEPSLSGRRHEPELDSPGFPQMELEQLSSGDYVMQIRMRLTSKELQNFTARRAENLEYLVKGSAMERYIAGPC